MMNKMTKTTKKRNLFFQSKKANAFLDLMTVMLILIGFAICSIIGYRIFNDLNADIQNDDDMNADAKALSDNLHGKYPSLFDNLFLFLVILLWVFLIVSSSLIDAHPMFFIITIILLIIGFIVSIEIGNSFEELTEMEEINSVISEFPITFYICTHLLELMIIYGATILITLYAKNKFING